jgi:hypothetical protein
MREHGVVPSVGGSDITGTQRPVIWRCEDPLQPLDFGNSLFNIHPPEYATKCSRRQILRSSAMPHTASSLAEPAFGHKCAEPIFDRNVP